MNKNNIDIEREMRKERKIEITRYPDYYIFEINYPFDSFKVRTSDYSKILKLIEAFQPFVNKIIRHDN